VCVYIDGSGLASKEIFQVKCSCGEGRKGEKREESYAVAVRFKTNDSIFFHKKLGGRNTLVMGLIIRTRKWALLEHGNGPYSNTENGLKIGKEKK
jgi:hypothetical protein